MRGDLTYYKDGWFGNHEFQTGFFYAPRNTYDQDTQYVNDGFVLEEHRLIDVNNIAAGTVPFRRRYQTPVDLRTRQAEDRDFAIYVQDSWRPHTAPVAQPRRPRRLRQAQRRSVRHHPPEQHRDRPALRLLLPC